MILQKFSERVLILRQRQYFSELPPANRVFEVYSSFDIYFRLSKNWSKIKLDFCFIFSRDNELRSNLERY